MSPQEAFYYSKLGNGRVQCDLCPHQCKIPEGRRGICLARENVAGRLIASTYCKPVSIAVDPIEKKPLFHFYPGTSILSAGPSGCTFKCGFCQNFELSQSTLPANEITVERFARMVEESGTIGIAYTYSEPTTWFETIVNAGRIVKERGLKNVMVTNGFIESLPLQELLTVVDAMNIDIKSMNPAFYRRICKGTIAPVLRACETVKAGGCHLEITYLLIPGENDSAVETDELAEFIAVNLGRDTPLHISRYFPRYRMKHPPTTASQLERAWEIARNRLDYVYVGNRASGVREHTYCPKCGSLLISRRGFTTELSPLLVARLDGQNAPYCATCKQPVNMVL